MKRNRFPHEKDENPSANKKLKLDNTNESKSEYEGVVNRRNLDFDGLFNKICSISFSKNNLYCCLSCGGYFQGRSLGSNGFKHSSKSGHSLLLNTRSKKIFKMPDSLEVEDVSLFGDIIFNVDPNYTPEMLISYYKNAQNTIYRDIFGQMFLPGFLPYTGGHSSSHVVFYLISSIKALRNEFLFHEYTQDKPLFNSFSEMLKKTWNCRNFKSSYNPNGILSTISKLSNDEYELDGYSDPKELLIWILNRLKMEITTNSRKKKKKKKKKRRRCLIDKLFRGKVFVKTERIEFFDEEEEEEELEEDQQQQKKFGSRKKEVVKNFKKTHQFLTLTLNVPDEKFQTRNVEDGRITRANYNNNNEENTSSSSSSSTRTIDFSELLQKFNGQKTTQVTLYDGDLENKKYQIMKLPEYLVFHFDRFLVNTFFKEKITTLVRFPKFWEIDCGKIFGLEGSHIYEMKVNIVHVGNLKTQRSFSLQGGINPEDNGSFLIQVYDDIRKKWIEILDSEVREVVGPEETIGISESYLALFKKKKKKNIE